MSPQFINKTNLTFQLTLALLMARVTLADHSQDSMATDYLAVLTALLDR